MDDQTSKENPSKDFNKLDLSQLQGFSFGTQWTQDKSAPSRGGQRRDDTDGEHPRRQGGEGRRDRRSFRKPAGAPGEGAAPAEGQQPPRREYGDRPPRREFRDAGGHAGQPGGQGGGDRPGGPRRDFRGGDRGPRREGGRPQQGDRDYRGGDRGPRHGAHEHRDPVFTGPYISPWFNIVFYPEDSGFAALAKAIRSSCRTYELFEIARVVVGKNDRFMAHIQRRQPGAPASAKPPRRQPQKGGQPAAAEGEAAPDAPAPAKPAPIAISVPDGIPFENEEAAIAHVLTRHLGMFFDSAEVEVEPPKGNYQIINKCGVTGELLGPPNYHLYNQIVQQHHATRVGRMDFESYRARIESVRDPEVVAQWLEKMKKTTRYTWKFTPPAEGAVAPAFDSFDEARAYLLATAREKVVRLVETARLHGKLVETMPQGELRRAIEGAVDRQRRFPLDTANALRGRLRREGFTIFKKGSKGISYVCAVKRKFRVPGQTFSDSIGALIAYIEANPMVKAGDLPAKFLGIQQPDTRPDAKPAPAEAPAPAAETTPAPAPAAETAATENTAVEPAAPADATPAPATEPAPAEVAAETTPAQETPAPETSAQPEAAAAEEQPAQPPIAPATSGSVPPFAPGTLALSAEDIARIHRLTGDLRWLVSEGYVTEFIDGCLFAPPAMTAARKQEVEKEEHDPENFPEAPAAATTAEAAPEASSATAGESATTEASTAAEPEAAEEPQAEEAAEPAPEPAAVAETETAPGQQPGQDADEPKAG